MSRGVFEGLHVIVLLVVVLAAIGVVWVVVRAASSSSGTQMAATPGGQWAPDPSGRHQLRYWNGVAWTDDVVDDGVRSLDPLAPNPGAPSH